MKTRTYITCPGRLGPDGRCLRCGVAIANSAGMHTVEIEVPVIVRPGTEFLFVRNANGTEGPQGEP